MKKIKLVTERLGLYFQWKIKDIEGKTIREYCSVLDAIDWICTNGYIQTEEPSVFIKPLWKVEILEY